MTISRAAVIAALFAALLSGCAVEKKTVSPGLSGEKPSISRHVSTGDFVIARDGNTECRIMVPDSASHAVWYAASELQTFVFRITGATIPIVTDRLPAGPHDIVLAPGARYRGLFPAADLRNLGEEGYIIRFSGDELLIAGGGDRGVLYGVYDILERFGCRWFTPEVDRIPRTDHLVLPPLDVVKKPVFEYRDTYLWEACDGDWAARNRLNRNGRKETLDVRHGGRIEWPKGYFAHTFERFVPKDKYFAVHPEYFSLVGGKRLKDQSQLCCTNEEVARIVAEGVKKVFRENPNATIVSISQNDWYNPCDCPACTELAEREGSRMAPLLLLVNRVAEEVEKEYPGKLVDTLAYQWSRRAPKTMRPRSNVVVRLCTIECCFSHSLGECTSPRNREFVRDLEEWSKVSDRLWIWNYVTSFSQFFMPFPDIRGRGDTVLLFTRNNVKGVFQQDIYTTPNGEFNGLSGYLNARLLWDPSTDTDAIVHEFLDGVYGPAAKPIGAYLDMIHAEASPESVHVGVWQGPDAEYLTDPVLARADSLFDAAEKAVAGDPEVLERVRIARLSPDYAIICRDRLRGGAYIVDHERRRITVDPAFSARAERFCSTAERAGVKLLREYDLTVKEFREDIAKNVRDRELPLIDTAQPSGTGPGLSAAYYEGSWRQLPDFTKLVPAKTAVSDSFALPFPGNGKNYVFVLKGYVNVPADGVYTFWSRSDGYSALTVAGVELFRNGGNDPVHERCGYVGLKKGLHPVELVYFTREGCRRLDVKWSGPGFGKRPVPAHALGRAGTN